MVLKDLFRLTYVWTLKFEDFYVLYSFIEMLMKPEGMISAIKNYQEWFSVMEFSASKYTPYCLFLSFSFLISLCSPEHSLGPLLQLSGQEAPFL